MVSSWIQAEDGDGEHTLFDAEEEGGENCEIDDVEEFVKENNDGGITVGRVNGFLLL